MKIIAHYFSRQFVTIFLMLLTVLTGLAWMVQIMSMMKFLLNYGVEFESFLGLTILMVPFIVSIIIPFVTFIAIIFVYNKMIADNEITVMAASTLSPWQLARPGLRFATVIAVIHFVLNIWIVPASQTQFYTTQWNLRYGLAHLKLQESAFTQMTPGLVVYVDKVSGHDLAQVMLSDMRDPTSQMTIFAEKGKLVATDRGMSIVMSNGSLQLFGNMVTVGTFDTFDMDLNVEDQTGGNAYRVRSASTRHLIDTIAHNETAKQHKAALAELASRLLAPWMNIILAALCTLILLRTSLLRRRASFAPALAVAAMAVAMAVFMSLSNMMDGLRDLGLLAGGMGITLGLLILGLKKK